MKFWFSRFFLKFREVLVVNARFSVWFWYRLHSSKVENLMWVLSIFFSNFDFFPTSECFSNIWEFKFGIYFFFDFNFFYSKFKITKQIFINETALRAPPAVTRLTVHRRLQVIPGRMPFGLICRLRNLLPGNWTEAISRNLTSTVDKREF